jgi:hypothetical protein
LHSAQPSTRIGHSPFGAYFAEGDEAKIVEQARRSAEVTHAP